MSYEKFNDDIEMPSEHPEDQIKIVSSPPLEALKDNFLDVLYNYEDQMSNTTSSEKFFVYKLKLYSFGSFHKHVTKEVLYQTITYTAADWLYNFHGLGAIVCQDRLILIGKSSFAGKTKKIETLIAGYCSTRFNHWLNYKELPKKYIDTAHFDCRLMQPEESDLRNLVHAAIYEYILQNKQTQQPLMTAIYGNKRCTVERMLTGVLMGI
jgi:hypothetical protein